MSWAITPGEDGFMLSEVSGHMSDPWGIILDQKKAMKLIEWLEWGDALENGRISITPPKKIIKRTRRTK